MWPSLKVLQTSFLQCTLDQWGGMGWAIPPSHCFSQMIFYHRSRNRNEDRYTGWFNFIAIVSRASKDVCVQVSLCVNLRNQINNLHQCRSCCMWSASGLAVCVIKSAPCLSCEFRNLVPFSVISLHVLVIEDVSSWPSTLATIPVACCPAFFYSGLNPFGSISQNKLFLL